LLLRATPYANQRVGNRGDQGGLGTLFGPAAGALILTAMETYLAQFGAWVTVTQGVIFVLCVLAFRRGVVGEVGAGLRLAL
jgi:branched-chain amino acid transport system permease protein